MRPYPKLWRQLVLAACDAGIGTTQAAKRFHCSPSWVRRAKQERRDLCKRGPYKTRCRNRRGSPLRERIQRLIIEDPGITVDELQRVTGQTLDTAMLAGIKTRLYMVDCIHWYGAEVALPRDWISEETEESAAAGRLSFAMWTLKQQIKELLTWRPETTIEELQQACGQTLSVTFLASIRDELSFFGISWNGASSFPLLATAPARHF